MLEVAIVVGNPKPGSRTAQIARRIVETLFDSSKARVEMIELSSHAPNLLLGPSPILEELTNRVASSDLAVFASPTYKATYTALLKAFLDRYGSGGPRDAAALAIMTGGDQRHSLAPQTSLVPLLLELGASIPCRGLYFDVSQIDDAENIVAAYAAEVRRSLGLLSTISVASNTPRAGSGDDQT